MKRLATIGLFTLLVALWPASMAVAQETAASLTGQVVDADDEPLPGANVVAVHQPTGTRYGTSTNADGQYTILNMRVGGPYVVRASFIGYQTVEETGVRLQLGERRNLDFELRETTQELEEVRVIARTSTVLNSEVTGANTNVSEEQIDQLPNVQNSIQTLQRLSPFAGDENSIAGANDRYNNIQIDGATLNDLFGLGDAIPGSQAGAQPISLAAIQEVNVDVAPYDVTKNGFTGGQINAVTRSGSNQFTGQAYFEGQNQNFVGALPTEGGGEATFSDFTELYTGFRLGGPIIEDKLFFFINGELKRESTPLTTGVEGSGASTIFPISPSTLEGVEEVARGYGLSPGSFGIINERTDNNKFLAKLDWNISDSHRLTLRHNYVDADDDDGLGRGEEEFAFTGRRYVFNSTQNSSVAELKSTFGTNSYNEARVVYTRIRDNRDLISGPVPSITLQFEDPAEATVQLGSDRFSQQNALDQDLIEITNNFTYITGDHEITLGTSNQIFSFENLFIQDAYGTYTFSEITIPDGQGGYETLSPVDAFDRGIPSEYRLSTSQQSGNPRPSVSFSGFQLGFYAQDRWTLSPTLNVTAGLRLDVPFINDDPLSNPQAVESFGRNTSAIPGGNILWAPRLGFNWDASGGEQTTQLRGGVGMFSGPPPLVWISNSFSNTGRLFNRIDADIAADDVVVDGEEIEVSDPGSIPPFEPDPFSQPTPETSENLAPIPTSEINLVTDDFRYPQTLRANLAIDQQLPFGFVGTLEGIYSKTVNNVVFENLNIDQVGTSATGRPLYGTARTFGSARNIVDENFTNALLLSNTNDGYKYNIATTLRNNVDIGLGRISGKVSYTYSRAENVNNGTSSRAISNWQFNENVDVNSPRLGTSDFEVRNRIIADVSFRFDEFLFNSNTTFSFFYEGRTGQPFSWIYFGDANADGQSFNDLVYIPTGENDPNVVLTSDNWDAVNAFIESEESLADNRGEFAQRNSATGPWRNLLDFRLVQRIPTGGNGQLDVTMDLLNVLNLINSEWGEIRFTSFNNTNLFTFEGYDDQGRTEFSFRESSFQNEEGEFDRDEIFQRSDIPSRWQLQLGVRYTF